MALAMVGAAAGAGRLGYCHQLFVHIIINLISIAAFGDVRGQVAHVGRKGQLPGFMWKTRSVRSTWFRFPLALDQVITEWPEELLAVALATYLVNNQKESELISSS